MRLSLLHELRLHRGVSQCALILAQRNFSHNQERHWKVLIFLHEAEQRNFLSKEMRCLKSVQAAHTTKTVLDSDFTSSLPSAFPFAYQHERSPVEGRAVAFVLNHLKLRGAHG